MSRDELLDLVNEQDDVIGEVWRNRANRDVSLLHREVGVILADATRALLLQQRALTKHVGPGYWTLTAEGHIGQGAAPITYAHLELQEELGFDTELQFWEKELIHLPNETHFTYWFTGKYSGQPLTLQESEVAQTALVTQSAFPAFVAQHLVSDYTVARAEKYWQVFG